MEPFSRFTSAQWTRVGVFIYAAAIMGLGLQVFLRQSPVPGLEPLTTALPGHLALTIISGVILLLSGLALLPERSRHLAALLLGAVFGLWFLLLHLPPLVAKPNGNLWTAAFETLALGGAAWAIARHLRVAPGVNSGESPTPGLARFGQVCYGVSLPVFGVLHIQYAKFVATLVPAWIPGHLFWTYFVAAAFLAGGAGIVSGMLARQAAIWTGIMFLSWVLIVHAPRVVLHPEIPAEWTSLLVALAMGGGAWIVAGIARHRSATPAADRV